MLHCPFRFWGERNGPYQPNAQLSQEVLGREKEPIPNAALSLEVLGREESFYPSQTLHCYHQNDCFEVDAGVTPGFVSPVVEGKVTRWCP